jgi:hypothetical protein
MTFLQHFNDHARRIHLVDKRKSVLMRFLSGCLAATNFLGLSAIRDFLGAYVTTLRSTIYASPSWTFDDTATPVQVHELTHVLQWSLLYALRYLFSAQWRCYYESEAVQATMMCFPQRRTEAFATAAAAHLVPYGVKYAVAMKIMAQRLLEAVDNKPQATAFVVYKQYMAWYSSEMKKPS